MTPHNSAEKGKIEKKVIMVGDPKRATFIAENYLDNFEIVSSVRGNNIYTGSYKGKKLTVMASGMGIPSMGIYAYELYNFYDVETIIRVGTAGAYNTFDLLDIVLAKATYSETSFSKTFDNEDVNIVYPSLTLNEKIINKAKEINLNIKQGNIACTDSFYMVDAEKYLQRVPKEFKVQAAEMESYALFYIANKLNKEAACILTISDIIGTNKQISADEREKGLEKAIKLAFEVL